MALTFKEIFRGTPTSRFNSSEFVRISKVKLTRKAGVVSRAVSKSSTPGGSDEYDTEIRFLPRGQVKLSCSCDDFLFRFEYALYRKGSADIRHSNGEPSHSTNPAFTPGCCKHVIALRELLVDRELVEGY